MSCDGRIETLDELLGEDGYDAVFLGIGTMGCMFVAIGLFFSSLTRNQIVAAIGAL